MIFPKQITEAVAKLDELASWDDQMREQVREAREVLVRLLFGEPTTITLGEIVCPKCDDDPEEIDITVKPEGGYFCMKCDHEFA